MGAGAGAQSRATDTHMVLRDHSEPGCVVVEAVTRSWAAEVVDEGLLYGLVRTAQHVRFPVGPVDAPEAVDKLQPLLHIPSPSQLSRPTILPSSRIRSVSMPRATLALISDMRTS